MFFAIHKMLWMYGIEFLNLDQLATQIQLIFECIFPDIVINRPLFELDSNIDQLYYRIIDIKDVQQNKIGQDYPDSNNIEIFFQIGVQIHFKKQ